MLPSNACAALGTCAQLEQALRLATILKSAKVAASELAGRNRNVLAMAASIRRRYGNDAVVITEGGDGCTIVARDTAIRVPAFRVKQVDATGAGDLFAGAFLWSLTEGHDLEACTRMGCIAASEIISHVGARREADLRALFQAHGAL